MNNIKIALLLLLGILSTAVHAADPGENGNRAELRILFVGNSLTYTNNLPGLVKKAGRKKGLQIAVKRMAHPNYALVDHWLDGDVQREIATGQYDLVIVQQGPSSQPEGRKMLMEYGKRFSAHCREHKAGLAFFMVWPSLPYYHTYDGVIQNYREAAETNNALLLPVGEVWKAHFDATGDFDYYADDGFHPSLKGSKAAADIIVEHLLK